MHPTPLHRLPRALTALALVCWCALFGAACDSDYAGPDPEPNPCTESNTVEHEGETYCIVIEEGFLLIDCPDDFPEGTQVDDIVVCGPEEAPESIRETLEEEGYLCPDPNDPNVEYISTDVAECADLGFSCTSTGNTGDPDAGVTRRAFNNACGCGCAPGLPDTNNSTTTECPDPGPGDPYYTYVSQDPQECATLDFTCDIYSEPFSSDCGCGCVTDTDPCPNPDNPRVDYISRDQAECAGTDYTCPEGHDAIESACGCGCIAPEDPVCPDPNDPRVDYLATDIAQCPEFQCDLGDEAFYDEACGCGCIEGAQVNCPDIENPEVTYVSQDPQECADLDFTCGPGQRAFSDACGCGCINTEAPDCPDANDPDITYLADQEACGLLGYACDPGFDAFDSACGCGCARGGVNDQCPDPDQATYLGNPVECDAGTVDFTCAPGEEAFFDPDCGCGCIDPSALACPDPDDPRVGYIATAGELCPPFQCSPGYESFNSEACGCGCIAPEEGVCRDPEDPAVTYLSSDPNGCQEDPDAPAGLCGNHYRAFSDPCGCGCEAIDPDVVCPAPTDATEVEAELYILPNGCYDPFQDNPDFGGEPFGVIASEDAFLERFECEPGTESGLAFGEVVLAEVVFTAYEEAELQGAFVTDEGEITVYARQPQYCGGPAPQPSSIFVVVSVADGAEVTGQGGCVWGQCNIFPP